MEGKNKEIRLAKETIRLQKEPIRLRKDAIKLGKEEIRLEKQSFLIRLQNEAPNLDQGFYQVESVRGKRVRKGQTQYLIKWVGWTEKHNTWEPIEHLQQCLDVVEEFDRRLRLRPKGKKRKLKGTFSQPKKTQTAATSEPSLSGNEDLVIGEKGLEEQSDDALVCEANIGTSAVLDPKAKSCSPDDWSKARKSSKGHKSDDDTATAGTEAPNDKGSPLKNQPLLCHKECQDGKGCHTSGDQSISCIPRDPGKVDLPKDDRSFALKVTSNAHLVETEIGNGKKPFLSLQTNDALQTGGSSPIMSSFSETTLNTVQDISFANTQTSGEKTEGQRSWEDGKARSGSGEVVHRVAVKEGKALEEVTAREQIKGSGGNSLGTLSPSSSAMVKCVAKPSPVPTVQTSSLPDLNTIPTSAFLHHHVTDSQQVQLRAQIFVYGSLIDETKPDEASMMSAFGEYDGGRSVWENVWSVADFPHQKSPSLKS
ncbi:hypothetical protein MKW94_025795 [Papaver nudicaule]|uniref:Chromo domain-containing protein n=1 Tax=Papaver nudicaule TaxID=74823 RepID=A0AA41RVP3_PAPNU|nr:hypothetical protein [Papaver nudicaule]